MVMGNNEISIVYIADRGFYYNTVVSIVSLKKNKEAETKYQVYLIAVDIERNVLEKLQELNDINFVIYIISISNTCREFDRDDSPVTSAALFKFELANILRNLNKVIYLDGDTLIQGDLSELYSTDIETLYAGVVVDILAMSMEPNVLCQIQCGHKFYFNSGMMLLNLKKMREDNIADKLFEYKRHGINLYMDQDALNVVFEERVIYLPAKFNYLTTLDYGLIEEKQMEQYGLDVKKNILEREKEAVILHLTGKRKPWKYQVPYLTDLFMHYYRMSPYADLKIFQPCQVDGWKRIYKFPFDKVKKGSRVVLFGAGYIGKQYYRQIVEREYCSIVLWVDQNYEKYVQVEYELSAPEKIKEINWDVIVIAIKSEEAVKQVRELLESYYVDRNKVIWSIERGE